MTFRLLAPAALLLAACSCPPPPATPATPEPVEPAEHQHGEHEGHHGKHEGHHGKHGEHGGKHGHHASGEGDSQAPLVHRFDDTDPKTWAKRFEGPERDAYQKPAEVVKALAIQEGMRVADIGAGTGYFLPHLAAAVGAGGRVLAVDVAPNMVRYLKARAAREGMANVDARLALLDDPLLEAGSLDRIILVNTWHHIPDREAYTATLAKALKPGGQVVVVDFKTTSDRGPAKMHKLPPETVASELKAGGLEPRIDATLLAEQYLVFGTKP